MPQNLQSLSTKDGITFKLYHGAGSNLMAFNADDHLKDNLAGFAITRLGPKGARYVVPNRLSFTSALTAASTATDRRWAPSDKSPFQKFWWADFPPADTTGYEVTAMMFSGETSIKAGPTLTASFDPGPFHSGDCQIAFTRGDLSSPTR